MLWKIILSALFLIFSFPNFNLSFLAFIGFVPLFLAIENKSPKKIFLIFYAAGFVFYLGTLYWLYHVTAIGLIIACLYLAVYFGIFGIAISRFGILSAPIVWVILEYIQANISIMGFGWALLGYSQYKNLPLIQIADFSGVYGVSFVVMMVNITAWRLVRAVTEGRGQRAEGREKNLRSVPCALCSMMLILALVYGYGFFRLNEKTSFKNAIKVSVIQGNVPQELKWDLDAQDMIIEKYLALTKMSALDNPDLVIWPETSFPGFFETDKDMTDKVLDLAKEIRIPILIGANTEGPSPFPLLRGERGILFFPLPSGERIKVRGYFNSAVLISIQGKVIDKYDKIHLVPFGEYVPFSSKFPVLHRLILGELGEFTPGNEFKIFAGNGRDHSLQAKFGVLICFEDIFPELARRFVKNGAQFLVVITNDAWYGRSGAAYQHAACSVFRAIENRVPVVRCANTGYSCFIDSRGRIYASVEDKGTHIFITGYKTSTLNIY